MVHCQYSKYGFDTASSTQKMPNRAFGTADVYLRSLLLAIFTKEKALYGSVLRSIAQRGACSMGVDVVNGAGFETSVS
jgi:hypothetical protein